MNRTYMELATEAVEPFLVLFKTEERKQMLIDDWAAHFEDLGMTDPVQCRDLVDATIRDRIGLIMELNSMEEDFQLRRNQ